MNNGCRRFCLQLTSLAQSRRVTKNWEISIADFFLTPDTKGCIKGFIITSRIKARKPHGYAPCLLPDSTKPWPPACRERPTHTLVWTKQFANQAAFLLPINAVHNLSSSERFRNPIVKIESAPFSRGKKRPPASAKWWNSLDLRLLRVHDYRNFWQLG